MHTNFDSIKLLHKINPQDVFPKDNFKVIWHDFVKEESKKVSNAEETDIEVLYDVENLDDENYYKYKGIVSSFVRNNQIVIFLLLKNLSNSY